MGEILERFYFQFPKLETTVNRAVIETGIKSIEKARKIQSPFTDTVNTQESLTMTNFGNFILNRMP